MNLSRVGDPLMLVAVVLAVLTFALALRVRSWPIWLAAFGLLIVALVIAWFARATPLVSALLSVPSGHA